MILALLLTVTLGQLEPGPHAAGFRVIEKYDVSRPYLYPLDLDGKPRRGAIDRPMQIGVWYPAVDEPKAKMKLAGYVALMAREQDFAAFQFRSRAGATPEERAKLMALGTSALRDGRPASGKSPVILWSFGSPRSITRPPNTSPVTATSWRSCRAFLPCARWSTRPRHARTTTPSRGTWPF